MFLLALAAIAMTIVTVSIFGILNDEKKQHAHNHPEQQHHSRQQRSQSMEAIPSQEERRDWKTTKSLGTTPREVVPKKEREREAKGRGK